MGNKEFHYMLLLRKDDVIDIFKYGRLFAYCPLNSFDGDIDKVVNNKKLATSIFDKANSFDYSIEYYLIHVKSNLATIKGKEIFIEDILNVFAIDENAYNIGLPLSPAINIQRPIWEDAYNEFQIKKFIQDADKGVDNICKIFGIQELMKSYKQRGFITKSTKDEVIRDVVLGNPMEGKHAIWYYLLRYERHQNYPKDNRGFFLDMIHSYDNFMKRSNIDKSMSENKFGSKILKLPESIKYHELVNEPPFEVLHYVDQVNKDVKYKLYHKVATLFFILQSFFEEGFVEGNSYNNHTLEEFANSLKNNYDLDDLIPALYLIGIKLGREMTYKYMYIHNNLPILK